MKTEDARRCVASLNGLYVLYKKLMVAFARKASQNIKCTNLFVAQIPPDFTEKELQKSFERYGTIMSCKIIYDKQIISVSSLTSWSAL